MLRFKNNEKNCVKPPLNALQISVCKLVGSLNKCSAESWWKNSLNIVTLSSLFTCDVECGILDLRVLSDNLVFVQFLIKFYPMFAT